jgi:tRNA(Ile)-lysidine synthase
MDVFTRPLKNLPTPVAVACSGGLDSIALLHAACNAVSFKGFQPLALHIDHGICSQSALWAQSVQDAANQLGAGFASIRVSGLSAAMPNLENAARNARHAALTQLCHEHGIATLLLAHHANDQAETVLLNLLRGSGLGGMGMPQSRQVGSTMWVRPWLHLSRSQIEAYAIQQALGWIEDPSNQDEALRRNAVRHTLWPVVQAVEPRALSSIVRFAGLAQSAAKTEQALAQACLKPFLVSSDSHLDIQRMHAVLGLDWLALVRQHDVSLQAVLLRTWLANLGCKAPSQARLYAMLEQLNARTGDGLRCSHGGYGFTYRERRLWAEPITL